MLVICCSTFLISIQAFLALDELKEMLMTLNELPSHCFAPGGWKDSLCFNSISQAVATRDSKAQHRTRSLIDFQLSAMYYECHCDLVVSYNNALPMSLESLRLFKKVQTESEYDYQEVKLKDAIKLCSR